MQKINKLRKDCFKKIIDVKKYVFFKQKNAM